MNKKFAIIALTSQGSKTAQQLADKLASDSNYSVQIYLPAKFTGSKVNSFNPGQFQKVMQEQFQLNDCLICIMATGIVVRSIAPMIKDKMSDPAVIVLDEKAHHIISLLSGHVGGANAWTKKISQLLNSDPVITTATDTENVQSLDMLAKSVNGWYPNFKTNTKQFNSWLAERKPILIYIEDYLRPYVSNLRGFSCIDDPTKSLSADPLVVVSDRLYPIKHEPFIQIIPQINVLGIGCRKNVTNKAIQEAFMEFCRQYNLAWLSFKFLASINIKQDEAAIQYLAQTLNISSKFYAATELQCVSQYYPFSDFVFKTVGVGNVACSAADIASGQRTITSRFTKNDITFALGRLREI